MEIEKIFPFYQKQKKLEMAFLSNKIVTSFYILIDYILWFLKKVNGSKMESQIVVPCFKTFDVVDYANYCEFLDVWRFKLQCEMLKCWIRV